MTHTTLKRGDIEELRRRLDRFRVGDLWESFVQAMDSFLTAVEYEDEALVRSHFEVVKTAVSDRFVSFIDDRVKDSTLVLDKFRETLALFEGEPIEPDEEFDAIGRSFEEFAREEHSRLTRLRDSLLAMLRKHDVEVANAAKLDEEIARWQSLQTDTIDCWPWTNGPLPPVDRELVEQSRSARNRGEPGEDLDALINRLKSE